MRLLTRDQHQAMVAMIADVKEGLDHPDDDEMMEDAQIAVVELFKLADTLGAGYVE